VVASKLRSGNVSPAYTSATGCRPVAPLAARVGGRDVVGAEWGGRMCGDAVTPMRVQVGKFLDIEET
jgi:hypothetical protein